MRMSTYQLLLRLGEVYEQVKGGIAASVPACWVCMQASFEALCEHAHTVTGDLLWCPRR
jgi:hypothetical protein